MGVTAKASAGEESDTKKPRRSQRISSQTKDPHQKTPLDGKSHLPSPLTNQEPSAMIESKEPTASPSQGRPSQIRQRTPPVSSPPNVGLSSPPGDTQPFSQFVRPPNTHSYEVEDEEAEGVWGYLVPIDSVFGDTLVLRKRVYCPAPYPRSSFGKGSKKRTERSRGDKNFVKEEADYEATKKLLGFPGSGYLIGRHPECGMVAIINALIRAAITC